MLAETPVSAADPRAAQILAKSIYRELRESGLSEREVMAIAGELLSLVASEVHERRTKSRESTA